MTKILVNSQGKALLTGSGKPLTKVSGGGHTGTVDTAGLTALGWDSYDIQWLQDHVWWDAADDAEWAVTEANKAFGPNGATPLTWNNKGTYTFNSDLRYFPKLSTPSSTNLQYYFSQFVYVVAIPTHGWDMTGKTSFNNLFTDCCNLRSIGDISNWNTASVTNMQATFMRCTSLETLDVSNWNTSKVTTFNETFTRCSNLKEIDASNFSYAVATTTSRMFADCVALEKIIGLSNKSAPALTNMSSMFYGDVSLKSVALSFNAPQLTNIESMFNLCYGISSISISLANSTLMSNARSCIMYCLFCESIDLTGLDSTSSVSNTYGAGDYQSIAGYNRQATTIKLGANFFKGAFTTLYMASNNSWSRDSIYESLYTNQTSRNSSSSAVTVKLATQAYDRLSAQDISDIATKNITLTRG